MPPERRALAGEQHQASQPGLAGQLRPEQLAGHRGATLALPAVRLAPARGPHRNCQPGAARLRREEPAVRRAATLVLPVAVLVAVSCRKCLPEAATRHHPAERVARRVAARALRRAREMVAALRARVRAQRPAWEALAELEPVLARPAWVPAGEQAEGEEQVALRWALGQARAHRPAGALA